MRRLLPAAISALALAVFFLSFQEIDAEEWKYDMRLWPAFAIAPSDMFVLTIIDEREDIRGAILYIDGENYFTSSAWEIAGKDGPRVKEFHFKRLPSGHYLVSLVVVGSSGKVLAMKQRNACYSGPIIDCAGFDPSARRFDPTTQEGRTAGDLDWISTFAAKWNPLLLSLNTKISQ